MVGDPGRMVMARELALTGPIATHQDPDDERTSAVG